jgi:outer membrane protein assembly factor BamB
MFPRGLGRLAATATGGALFAVACSAPALVDRRPVRRAPEPDSRRASAPVANPGARLTDEDRIAGIRWKLDAGSPIPAAPAVGPDGTVYVGTADGYLFGVGPEGVLAWSYTLEGAVVWAPVVEASGRLYVATAAQRLYSLLPGGTLGWQARTPARVDTELALAPAGVVFGGEDGAVWAYSEHGNPAFHVELGSRVLAGPCVVEGRTFVATAASDLLMLEGAVKRRRIRLGAPGEAIVSAAADGSTTLVVGGALVVLGPEGEIRLRREGVAWASVAGDGYLVVEGDVLSRLGADGAALWRTPLGGGVAAPPVLAPSGAIYVAGEDGRLAVLGARGEKPRYVPVARAALHRPVVDALRGRVVVSAGNGLVAGLRLEE